MKLSDIINHDLVCSCGRTHRCDIGAVRIGAGVLCELPNLISAQHIVLVSDRNTDALCGERVRALLGDRVAAHCYFDKNELLVPDEAAVAAVEALVTEKTDFILGIGSGVINDICKYVSFDHRIKCGIIATAPSMDGFASSGAAMIFAGMKVTFTTHAPDLILGDTDILCTAPADMIAAGFADIIGKYSALNDWKLSHLVNGEYLCPFVYDLVMEKTNEVRDLAGALMRREPEAIGTLTEILVMIGVCLTLLSTTRPGSGSEHHLSHYFEITGLILGKPYFLHGTDVGYSTVVTAGMRERICAIKQPIFHPVSGDMRARAYDRIYRDRAGEVAELQREAGRYEKDQTSQYAAQWDEILAILSECPTAKEIEDMLLSVGFDLSAFERMYGRDRISDGKLWGKDLKDRYSVLWLYFDLFGGITPEKPTTMDLMKQSLLAERTALELLHRDFDEVAFGKALALLKQSSLTVLSACGSSGFATKKFAHSLCCIECPAKFVPPSEAVHGGMGALKAGNVLLLVTKGGKTEELIPLADIAKKKGTHIILVTAHPERELGQMADVVLRLPDTPESDRFDVMSTASFAATIGIFDALMMGLMEEKDYSLAEFGLIHPGGAVGKMIN